MMFTVVYKQPVIRPPLGYADYEERRYPPLGTQRAVVMRAWTVGGFNYEHAVDLAVWRDMTESCRSHFRRMAIQALQKEGVR